MSTLTTDDLDPRNWTQSEWFDSLAQVCFMASVGAVGAALGIHLYMRRLQAEFCSPTGPIAVQTTRIDPCRNVLWGIHNDAVALLLPVFFLAALAGIYFGTKEVTP